MNNDEIQEYISAFTDGIMQDSSEKKDPFIDLLEHYVSRQFRFFIQSAQNTLVGLSVRDYTYTVLLLPTQSLNALVHRVPNSNHFLFIFDSNFPTYVHTIAKISSYALSGQECFILNAMSGKPEFDKKKLAELFARPAALMLDLFFTFLRTEGKISRELHPFGGDFLEDIKAHISRDNMYRFIIGHEFGHIVNGDLDDPLSHTSTKINGNSVDVVFDGWEKEHKADEFSLLQILRSEDLHTVENIKGAGSTLISVLTLLESFSLYERFCNYVYTGEYKEGVSYSETHPPAIERITRLSQTIDKELSNRAWQEYPSMPASVEVILQAQGLRSAWLLNETTVLPNSPNLQSLERIWIEVKALNERNHGAYILPERDTAPDTLFSNDETSPAISSKWKDLETLRMEAMRRAKEVECLSYSTPLEERISLYLAFGNALSRLGMHTSDTENLEGALAIYEELLAIIDRDARPHVWAQTMFNIGVALQEIGRRDTITDRLTEAEVAYREALTIRTRESNPKAFAVTSTNLGITLLMLGRREISANRLKDAISAFNDAIGEQTKANQFDQADLVNSRRSEALELLAETQGRRCRNKEVDEFMDN